MVSRLIKRVAEALLDSFYQRRGLIPSDVLINDVEAQKLVSELTWQEILPEVEKASPKKASQIALELRGLNPRTTWWKVETVDDERLCARCRAWSGRILSNYDPTLPTPDDWIAAGAKHPNCRCRLVLVMPRETWSELHGEDLMRWARLNSQGLI